MSLIHPTPPPIALVVHGHFYQPPRENPWTDRVAREPSAAPFHDWNERIHDECYRANAYARLYGPRDRVRTLLNNYSHLSFNFGPTLARWMEAHDPGVMARLRAGDEEQRQRLGHGGAMAQVWAHPIAPLCTPRDRRTQIRWGLLDFERRFGRKAEGIWLPETAVDPATLEDLIEAGLKYTILAPEQIAAVRAPGGKWTPVDRDTIDTGQLYRWMHGDGSGRSIALAIFDGPLSRDLAFGTSTRDSESFVTRVEESAARSSVTEGPRLVMAASDGELYGHHKKFADLMLAHALEVEAPRRGVTVTNLGALLDTAPPTWEAELAKGPGGEGTAWSCAHGVGRWQRHCGCAMRSPDESGWSQAWRTPLRGALDVLRDRAAVLFEDLGGDLFQAPWDVRDDFGAVLEASPEERRKFLRKRGKNRLRGWNEKTERRTLLAFELQRATLLMYASCGWFFDDVAGVESALVIRQAAFALDLWKELGGRPPTGEVLDRLAEARSNFMHAGTGADVFHRVSQHRTTTVHAVAGAALSELSGAAPLDGAYAVPGFTIKMARGKNAAGTVKGKAAVVHTRTGDSVTLAYEASAKALLYPICRVGKEAVGVASLPDEVREPVVLALLARLANAPKLTVKDCARALELARSTAGAGESTGALYHPAFADLLPRLLAVAPPAKASQETVQVVSALLAAVPEASRPACEKRVQEWVWEGLTASGRTRQPPSPALRGLADRVGFALEDELHEVRRRA